MSLASKLAYEDPVLINYVCKNMWNMETNDSLNFAFKDLRAFIMHDRDNIVLSFRGTEIINPKDWSTDVQLKFSPMIHKQQMVQARQMKLQRNLIPY